MCMHTNFAKFTTKLQQSAKESNNVKKKTKPARIIFGGKYFKSDLSLFLNVVRVISYMS